MGMKKNKKALLLIIAIIMLCVSAGLFWFVRENFKKEKEFIVPEFRITADSVIYRVNPYQ